MKKITQILLVFMITTAVFISCKKDENQLYYSGGTEPVLKASSTAAMVLDKNNKDNFAIKFDWTNPNYQFNTGISSQDVTYTLQFDTAGANFTSKNIQEKAISKDLSVSFTVKDINTFLGKMELKPNIAYNMEIRVKATLINASVPLYSNVIKIKITPYLDFAVEPPGTASANYLDGNLWIVGDAVVSGWSNPLPAPYDVSQKFSRAGGTTDILHYEKIVTFLATGGYKLIQQQGVWSTQYHAIDGTAKLSGDFEKKDADPQFPSPGAGNYKVEVNFQTGKYTLTKQ